MEDLAYGDERESADAEDDLVLLQVDHEGGVGLSHALQHNAHQNHPKQTNIADSYQVSVSQLT
jgi:hypothetical protein